LKYTITCPKCSTQYLQESKYLEDKEQLICPNCNKRLSVDTLNKLKNIDKVIKENSKNLDDALKVNIEGTIKGSSVFF